MSTLDPFKISERTVGNADLTGKYRLDWIEETVNLTSEAPRSSALSYTSTFLGSSISERKIRLFLVVLFASIIILSGRILYLQVWRGSHFYSLAEGNRIRIQPIIAERGIFYDRNGVPLVQNVPNFALTLIPQDLPHSLQERDKIISRAANLAGVSKNSLDELLRKYGFYSYDSLIIKENIDYTTALAIYLQSDTLPGIAVESGTKRNYFTVADSATSSVTTLSHVLGYTGKLSDQELTLLQPQGYSLSDSIGKSGLEKNAETVLRGNNGRKRIEVDARGREQNILAVQAPQPGKNITLSIDLEAQRKLENIMRRRLALNNKSRAAAIALNPETGEVLALVSLPTFDNNDFANGISETKYRLYVEDKNLPLFNRAIAGLYPPGSTVKLVVAAAALEEKIVNSATTILSTGGLRIGKWFFKDWRDGGHGITNVTKAIAWSINTFFYYVGGGRDAFAGLGLDRLLAYFRVFNIAQKTGIDLPGEASGFLPSREWKMKKRGDPWFIGDTYNLSIGQGDLLVTPIQAAVWTAAVANGGSVVQPRLINKITDPATNEEYEVKTKLIRRASVKPENLAVVKRGMAECVSYGSCRLLANLPFSSGGKTGTAQWSKNHATHAWFTSFAPFNNPKIVVTVLVEEGGEGGFAAMPIAEEFLVWWGQKYLTPAEHVL